MQKFAKTLLTVVVCVLLYVNPAIAQDRKCDTYNNIVRLLVSLDEKPIWLGKTDDNIVFIVFRGESSWTLVFTDRVNACIVSEGGINHIMKEVSR